jgi:3-hydroxy-3-methylglutaryl CoA synthase
MTGITSYGAYIPRLRLQRKSVAQANAWFAPGLVGTAKGERAMANFDEDALTMAVEAGRDCLPAADPITDRAFVDAAYFASTTMPFSDRQNAGIAAAALNLPEAISSFDVTSSQRAGTSALIAALDAVKAGRVKAPLIVAGEKRKARAASSQELAYGDAAAAFTLGHDKVITKFLGSHSLTIDFVDHFRGADEDYDYNWEERWIRDEGYTKIVPGAIKGLFEKTGVSGADIAHLILPCPFAKLDQTLAKACGIDPAKVRDNLAATVGDAGACAGKRQAGREDSRRAIRPGLRRAAVRGDAGHRGFQEAQRRVRLAGAAQGRNQLQQISRLQRADRARERHARGGRQAHCAHRALPQERHADGSRRR